MADVDELARPVDAHQQPRDVLDRLLRGGQPDALERRVAPVGARLVLDQGLEPLERQREVCAALAAGDGVDLVHDHRAHRLQHRLAAFARQQDGERFRCRDEDVGRTLPHRGALAGRRVAAANQHPDLGEFGLAAAQLVERGLEVLLDVVAERAERGDIEHRGLVGQRGP
jgi:hypothetical protein